RTPEPNTMSPAKPNPAATPTLARSPALRPAWRANAPAQIAAGTADESDRPPAIAASSARGGPYRSAGSFTASEGAGILPATQRISSTRAQAASPEIACGSHGDWTIALREGGAAIRATVATHATRGTHRTSNQAEKRLLRFTR